MSGFDHTTHGNRLAELVSSYAKPIEIEILGACRYSLSIKINSKLSPLNRQVNEIRQINEIEMANQVKQHVILVHGLAAEPGVFWLMSRRLRKRGFVTKTWGYFSVRGSIEKHAERLGRFLSEYPLGEQDTVHLVAHSMGAIICRRVLHEQHKLGRIVLLAPPNHGSPVATRLERYLGWLCPAIRELSTNGQSYVRQLDPCSGYEIGVIRAKSDWLVPIENASLSSAQETIDISTWHSGLLFNRQAAKNIACFLETGQFLAATETIEL